MTADERFMNLAIRLALKGQGKVSPNPMVGAVIVKQGKIVGRGFHHRSGRPHAEINALRQAGRRAKGATLYVTLEPCCSFGKTPPCADAIIKSGIKQVVIASRDQNPLNKGGIAILKKKGLKVKTGVLRQKARDLNESYFKFITQQSPFVVVKIAETLDGKIATASGNSKWITSPPARRYSHRLRGQTDAILVGINTILRDNPLLTTRYPFSATSPVKIIVDSKSKLPLNAKILSRMSPAQTIVATTRFADKSKIKALQDKGVHVITDLPARRAKNFKERLSLKSLMKRLAKLNITSVLIEGGGEIIASALEEKIVDKLLIFIAPKIIGGEEAVTSVEGRGINRINQAIRIRGLKIKKIGQDILIEGYPVYNNPKSKINKQVS